MSKNIVMVCPHCGNECTLGINGVMNGCDKCEQIQRNKAGLIIYPEPTDEYLMERYAKGPTKQQS